MIATSTMILAAQVAGMAMTGYGMVKKGEADKEAAQASRDAEAARRKQAQLTAAKEQRDLFRKAQAARAVGNANLTNMNAQFGSGMGGMEGQIAGQLDSSSFDLASNLKQGMNIFDANARYANARRDGEEAEAWGKLGGDIFTSAEKIGRVGSTVLGGPNQDHGKYNWDSVTTVRKA
jgi:hypothetical protein